MATKKQSKKPTPFEQWRKSRHQFGLATGSGAWAASAASLAAATDRLLPAAEAANVDLPLHALIGHLRSLRYMGSGRSQTADLVRDVEPIIDKLEWQKVRNAESAKTDAKPGLNDDRYAVLRRLAKDYPNAVKIRDIRADKSLPLRVRAERALRKELKALRDMTPPMAAKGEKHGYHVATPEGAAEAEKQATGR